MSEQIKEDSQGDKNASGRRALVLFAALVASVFLLYFLVLQKPAFMVEPRAKASNSAALEARLSTPERSDPIEAPLDDTAGWEERIQSLEKALEELRGEMSRTSETTRLRAHSGAAAVVAFVGLHGVALGGAPFEGERKIMERVASGDAKTTGLLKELEPYAADGVPTPSSLRDMWRDLAPEVRAARRRSGAQTWQERLAVTLETLVSVRPLAGGEEGKSASFEIDADLSKGKLGQALEKLGSLSGPAGELAAPFAEKLRARHDVERLLTALAARLIDMDAASAQGAAAEKAVP